MESPQLALLLSLRATEHYVASAQPDAPVVGGHGAARTARAERRRRQAAARADVRVRRAAQRPLRAPVLGRPRASLAAALHRAADAVAPSYLPRGLVR